MHACMHAWADEWVCAWNCMDGGAWMDGWMDGRTDGRTDGKQHVRERFAMGPRGESNNPRKFLRNRPGTQETRKEHAIMPWVYPVLPSAAAHPKPWFEA